MRWHLIDRGRRMDFSSVLPMVAGRRAARYPGALESVPLRLAGGREPVHPGVRRALCPLLRGRGALPRGSHRHGAVLRPDQRDLVPGLGGGREGLHPSPTPAAGDTRSSSSWCGRRSPGWRRSGRWIPAPGMLQWIPDPRIPPPGPARAGPGRRGSAGCGSSKPGTCSPAGSIPRSAGTHDTSMSSGSTSTTRTSGSTPTSGSAGRTLRATGAGSRLRYLLAEVYDQI